MPAWLAPVATLAATGIQALASAKGQKAANQTNIQLAREQMRFQREMSNTAYQRAVKDMRSAGLNPMLAFQQGGASTPGGASATVESVVPDDVASSALHAKRVLEEVKNLKSSRDLMYNQALNQRNSAEESAARREEVVKRTDVLEEQLKQLRLQIPALKNSAKAEQSIPEWVNVLRLLINPVSVGAKLPIPGGR